ncbi:MAG: bile acid:sodium symporter family protein [Gemmatimonadota bacterium]|nr:bile acid:sodium symporter family protein [Gemmatimonadota bacterium]MDH5760204.1 bile acid:sodium symporter family protein [Gemmatimonadota bacterium]
MNDVDALHLAFEPATLVALNVVLGFVMFGVALDLSLDDFRRVARAPRGAIIGLTAQFVLLPAATWGLTMLLDMRPSIALGMILIAACPGGNISNVITHLARGNTALSIGMTALSTVTAVVMTPFNVTFWGRLNPDTAALLREVSLDPVELLLMVFTILGIPLVAGMAVAARRPEAAARIRRPMKVLSIVFFAGIVIVALRNNWENFLTYVGVVMALVALHNAVALGLGYGAARAVGLSSRDARAVSIEVGIQNSALGLTLIFTFFAGLGGMALVAAWWGIWHILAGLGVAALWAVLDGRMAGSGRPGRDVLGPETRGPGSVAGPGGMAAGEGNEA